MNFLCLAAAPISCKYIQTEFLYEVFVYKYSLCICNALCICNTEEPVMECDVYGVILLDFWMENFLIPKRSTEMT